MVGVAAIEDADLHVLERRDVADELHADLFERRAAGREMVLEHPLAEAFAEHRPIVGDAEIVGEQLALAIAGGGGDAVDHAVGEGDVVRDPGGEFGIEQLGEADHGVRVTWPLPGMLSQLITVNGAMPSIAAALEAGEDQPEGGAAARQGVLGVGDDVGMGGVEALGRRVDVIAALGDGQRDDADRGSARRAMMAALSPIFR